MIASTLCRCGEVRNEGGADASASGTSACVRISETAVPLNFRWREVNLGEMRVGERKDTVFPFVNVSDGAVLRDVVAGGGCTPVRWPKNPVMPADSARIDVGFTARNAGVFDKKIFVSVSGADVPLTLSVRGTVLNGSEL